MWSNQAKAKSILKERTYLETNIEKIVSIEEDLKSYIEMIEFAETEKDDEIYNETLDQLKEIKPISQKSRNRVSIEWRIR